MTLRRPLLRPSPPRVDLHHRTRDGRIELQWHRGSLFSPSLCSCFPRSRICCNTCKEMKLKNPTDLLTDDLKILTGSSSDQSLSFRLLPHSLLVQRGRSWDMAAVNYGCTNSCTSVLAMKTGMSSVRKKKLRLYRVPNLKKQGDAR